MIEARHLRELTEAIEPIYDLIIPDARITAASVDKWCYPMCDRWSEIVLPMAQAALGPYGAQIEHIVCEPTDKARVRYGMRDTYHHFLADISDPRDPVVIDGSYLQYSRTQQGNQAPHVLVSAASQTPPLLEKAQIYEQFQHIWRLDLFRTGVYSKIH